MCARVCVACMSRCKAPGFICLDGGLEALTHVGPCNALLSERRLWIYFTASRCACLFMSFYVAIFLASVDGRLTDRRQHAEGGTGAEAEADRKRSRKSVCQFNVPFAFKYLPQEIIHAKSVRIFSTFHLLTVYRYCVKCQQINNMRRNIQTHYIA